MKVKVSELKTHLSSYLKNIDEAGEIEVCLREEPVAYLISAETRSKGAGRRLVDCVDKAGLVLSKAAELGSQQEKTANVPIAEPAGDNRTDIVTVDSLRNGRDY